MTENIRQFVIKLSSRQKRVLEQWLWAFEIRIIRQRSNYHPLRHFPSINHFRRGQSVFERHNLNSSGYSPFSRLDVDNSSVWSSNSPVRLKLPAAKSPDSANRMHYTSDNFRSLFAISYNSSARPVLNVEHVKLLIIRKSRTNYKSVILSKNMFTAETGSRRIFCAVLFMSWISHE